MNHSDPSLFDPRVATWLEDDPHEAPDTALPVVLAAFPSIKQRRGRAPWRIFGTSSRSRFAAAGATLVALVVVALVVVGPWFATGLVGMPTSPPTASPTPTPGPTASVSPSDTSAWTEYASDRYGFRISYPAGWSVVPPDHDWTMADAADVKSTGQVRFRSPAEDVAVSVWEFDPGPDVRLDTVADIVTWVEGFCAQTSSSPCTGIAARAVPLCRESRDCHPAVLVPFRNDTYAFISGNDETALTIAAVWRPESDPSVAADGGAQNLLLTFLSTLHGGGSAGVVLDPTPPSLVLPPTDGWTRFTSDRYGYEISYPPGWTATPATRAWTAPDADVAATDVFADPTGDVAVSAWKVEPGAGVSLETVDELIGWVATYCDQGLSRPCDGIAERAVPMCMERADCHPAVLVPFGEKIVAFAPGVGETAMTIVAIHRPEGDPVSGPYGGSRQVLLDFLSTLSGGGVHLPDA